MIIKTLKQAIDLAVGDGIKGEVTADFTIEVEDKPWRVYTAAIGDSDILCYCEEGTASFVVDSYHDRHVTELFDWSTNDE